MQQTVTISGLSDHGEGEYALALEEAMECLNREPQAVLEFIGEARENGSLTVDSAEYDNTAGTITVVRTWTADAWATYQSHQDNIDFIVGKMTEAGFTVNM